MARRVLRPKIDPEISTLFGEPCPEEYAQLKANLERDGQQEKAIVWKEKGILLDGHCRLQACEELGIPFGCKVLSFDTREEAIEWVFHNQFGRRNLTKDKRNELLAARVEYLKKAKAKDEPTGKQGDKWCHSDTTSPHGDPGTGDVLDQVATENKVSRSTVVRAVHELKSKFCERCQRVGARPGCVDCKKAREDAKTAQAVRTLLAKPKSKRSKKSGSVKIAWDQLERNHIGPVVRLMDDVKQHYKDKINEADVKDYYEACSTIERLFNLWRKQCT
jgi:ParB-like chromosome segregation protein Spo0J